MKWVHICKRVASLASRRRDIWFSIGICLWLYIKVQASLWPPPVPVHTSGLPQSLFAGTRKMFQSSSTSISPPCRPATPGLPQLRAFIPSATALLTLLVSLFSCYSPWCLFPRRQPLVMPSLFCFSFCSRFFQMHLVVLFLIHTT